MCARVCTHAPVSMSVSMSMSLSMSLSVSLFMSLSMSLSVSVSLSVLSVSVCAKEGECVLHVRTLSRSDRHYHVVIDIIT